MHLTQTQTFPTAMSSQELSSKSPAWYTERTNLGITVTISSFHFDALCCHVIDHGHLLIPHFILILRVSSVLNRDSSQYGKKFMFDKHEDTCWNSDQVCNYWKYQTERNKGKGDEIVLHKYWIKMFHLNGIFFLSVHIHFFNNSFSSYLLYFFFFFWGGGGEGGRERGKGSKYSKNSPEPSSTSATSIEPRTPFKELTTLTPNKLTLFLGRVTLYHW